MKLVLLALTAIRVYYQHALDLSTAFRLVPIDNWIGERFAVPNAKIRLDFGTLVVRHRQVKCLVTDFDGFISFRSIAHHLKRSAMGES